MSEIGKIVMLKDENCPVCGAEVQLVGNQPDTEYCGVCGWEKYPYPEAQAV